jgi:hypothetical protein
LRTFMRGAILSAAFALQELRASQGNTTRFSRCQRRFGARANHRPFLLSKCRKQFVRSYTSSTAASSRTRGATILKSITTITIFLCSSVR